MTGNTLAPGAPALAPYNISIAMSDATVEALDTLKSSLYLFKASASPMGGGKPTVWSSTKAFSNDTQVNWTESYGAYAAIGEVKGGVTFQGSSAKPIDLGESLLVSESAITKVSQSGGTPDWITVTNTTTTPFACGMAQPDPATGKLSPICAFPLYGKYSDLIQPIEKIALVFATTAYKQGTVVEGAIGPAILVDLTAQQKVALAYDINNGWTWNPTDPVSDINDSEFVSVLVTTSSDPALSGGSGSGGEDATVEVLQPTVFTMSQGQHWLPITEIAHGLRGHADGRTLAFKLAGGGGVVKGATYIVTYYTRIGNVPVSKAYRAVCTYVPMYPDNPFDFKLVEDVTEFVFG